MHKGAYFAVSVYDVDGNLLNPQNLEKQLQYIVDSVKQEESTSKGWNCYLIISFFFVPKTK